MDPVAAETYLRCRLEDALQLPEYQAVQDVAARVRAVLAVGLIDDGIAERVLADAASASRVRAPDEHRHFGSDDDHAEAAQSRVVVCPTVIACDWGTLVVTHVVLDSFHPTLGVRGTISAPRTSHRHHFDEPWMTVEVLDPSGTKHAGSFGGGSSDTTFDGEYRLDTPIPFDAAWIAIAGHRIELAEPPPPPPVRVRTIDELSIEERAARHLRLLQWQRHSFDEDESGAAGATFADLGIEMRNEPDAAPSRSRRARRRRGRGRPGLDPEPRLAAVGATTPTVDGITVNLTTLSDTGELGYTGGSAGPVNGDAPRAMVRISAVDDLGTEYECEHGGSGHDGSTFHGTVRLDPPLDPNAIRLTIVIDTLRHRLDVDVPLVWQELR